MTERDNDFQQALAHKAVVESLWTEPLFGAVAELLPRPDSATMLVAEARCGFVPLHLAPSLADGARIIALDGHGSMLDLARKRAEGGRAEERIYFVAQRVADLSYADGVFQAGICLDGLNTAEQARRGILELSRVTAAGGKIVAAAPLASSYPEFYDLLDEAMRAHRIADQLPRIAEMRNGLVSVGHLGAIAEQAGLEDVRVERLSWEVTFEDGHDFLHSPLVRQSLFSHWMSAVRSADREPVLRHLSDAIDTYWHGRNFVTEIDAAVIFGTPGEPAK